MRQARDRYQACSQEFEAAANNGDYEGLLALIHQHQLLRDDWGAQYSKALGNAARQGFTQVAKLVLSLPPIRARVADGAQFAFREALRYGKQPVLELLFQYKAVHQMPSDHEANRQLVYQAFYNAPHSIDATAAADTVIYALEHHDYIKQHQEQWVLQVYGNTQRMIDNARDEGSTWLPGYQTFCEKMREHFQPIFARYPRVASGEVMYDCTQMQWKHGEEKVSPPWERVTQAQATLWSASHEEDSPTTVPTI